MKRKDPIHPVKESFFYAFVCCMALNTYGTETVPSLEHQNMVVRSRPWIVLGRSMKASTVRRQMFGRPMAPPRATHVTHVKTCVGMKLAALKE